MKSSDINRTQTNLLISICFSEKYKYGWHKRGSAKKIEHGEIRALFCSSQWLNCYGAVAGEGVGVGEGMGVGVGMMPTFFFSGLPG